MSLYREARPRRRRRIVLAGAVLAVLVAVALAVALTRGGEPSSGERLESLRGDVAPALSALELVPIHYESTNPTTHAAAADQLAVAEETVDEREADLRALDAAATRELRAQLVALEELVRTTGRAEQVEEDTAAAAATLRSIVGLEPGRR